MISGYPGEDSSAKATANKAVKIIVFKKYIFRPPQYLAVDSVRPGSMRRARLYTGRAAFSSSLP